MSKAAPLAHDRLPVMLDCSIRGHSQSNFSALALILALLVWKYPDCQMYLAQHGQVEPIATC